MASGFILALTILAALAASLQNNEAATISDISGDHWFQTSVTKNTTFTKPWLMSEEGSKAQVEAQGSKKICGLRGSGVVKTFNQEHRHGTNKASKFEYFTATSQNKILQDPVVEYINRHPNAGWKADMNSRFSNYTVGQFKHLLGVLPTPKNVIEDVPVRAYPKGLKLPKQFDARKAWPQCSSVQDILDQGHCGSCWAFGAAEALSDRFCIHYNVNVTLSENDLVACCGFQCGDGCEGGYPLAAWQYFISSGVVTAECDPYFDDAGCQHPGCEPLYPTPQCQKQCKDLNQNWVDSKRYSATAYRIASKPYDIMTEVFTNGPVEVSFSVFEDFAHYKSGVYKYIKGDYMGGHAVKLIGWGTSDDGVDYWLVANSWNRSWGEDGLFKIARGTNECGIEEDVVAGMPSTKNLVVDSAVAAEQRASW